MTTFLVKSVGMQPWRVKGGESMRPEVFVIIHVVFGMFGILAALWMFVETLNSTETNQRRIEIASVVLVICIWLSYVLGGYYYVNYYAASKAVILAGPFPSAHKFFMEVKEHLFFMVLLLATYAPFAVYGERLYSNKGARHLVLAVSALVVILGLVMDGSGAMIIMGEKLGLLRR
jgi:hypothetical protein